MGQRYTITRDNFTPTAGQDVFTIVSASGRRVRLVDLQATGQGSSSAAQRLIAARSSAGTTPGGAITPNKGEHTDQPAAASTVDTTWAVQPTIDANGVVLGFNALGGANRLPPPSQRPGGILEARNGENISVRAPAGPTYQAMSVSAIIEED